MINESNFRRVLAIMVASFVVPIIIVQEAGASFGLTDRLLSYTSYAISIIFFVTTIRSSRIAGLFGDYIGGRYIGTSQRISDMPHEPIENNQITIKQTLTIVKLTGSSFDTNGNQNATYTGNLIQEENGHYTFYVKIVTANSRRDGLIELNFNNKPVSGFCTGLEVGGGRRWRMVLTPL